MSRWIHRPTAEELLTVLQYTSIGNINTLTFIGDNCGATCKHRASRNMRIQHTNDGTTKGDIATEVDIARDSQVIQLNDLRNLLESLLELRNLIV